MDSKRNRPGLQILIWTLFLLGLAIAGCQLIVPQQEWSKKKWGPLVPHTKFPGDCSICHLPDRWDQLREDFSFDHEKETGYPLEGGHADAACLRCHNDRGPVEVYVARGCAGCHIDIHAGSLGMDCERCHSQISWEPTGLVGEHARTRFPLVGAHAITACDSCHVGGPAGDFRGAPLDCAICHRNDAAQTTDPNHIANGWVSDCQLCHTPVGWNGANIRHYFFPLTGGHGGLDCGQCHTTPGTFTGLSQDCYSCHSTDFQNAPGHVEQNFSQDCTACHSMNGWSPVNFDHSFFPLTGEHARLSCTECHSGGTYSGLSAACYSCHETDYQGAPDHVALNFPQNCEECHSTSAWTPAAIDHSFFALTGGHSGLSCTQCHVGGTYTGLSQDCYSCHDNDFQNAPDHVSLGFPLNCAECHTINGWSPASFQHNFPLSGNHNASCTTCHDSGSTQSFTCFNCHTHAQGVTDEHHSEVSGYSYNSQACYNCHPNGQH